MSASPVQEPLVDQSKKDKDLAFPRRVEDQVQALVLSEPPRTLHTTKLVKYKDGQVRVTYEFDTAAQKSARFAKIRRMRNACLVHPCTWVNSQRNTIPGNSSCMVIRVDFAEYDNLAFFLEKIPNVLTSRIDQNNQLHRACFDRHRLNLCKSIIRQIADFVFYLECVGASPHRNITPETILFQGNGRVKLGFPDEITESSVRNNPEHYYKNNAYWIGNQQNDFDEKLVAARVVSTFKDDIWAIGAVAYSIMTGINLLPTWGKKNEEISVESKEDNKEKNRNGNDDKSNSVATATTSNNITSIVNNDERTGGTPHQPTSRNPTQSKVDVDLKEFAPACSSSNEKSPGDVSSHSEKFDQFMKFVRLEATSEEWKNIFPDPELRRIVKGCLAEATENRFDSFQLLEAIRGEQVLDRSAFGCCPTSDETNALESLRNPTYHKANDGTVVGWEFVSDKLYNSNPKRYWMLESLDAWSHCFAFEGQTALTEFLGKSANEQRNLHSASAKAVRDLFPLPKVVKELVTSPKGAKDLAAKPKMVMDPLGTDMIIHSRLEISWLLCARSLRYFLNGHCDNNTPYTGTFRQQFMEMLEKNGEVNEEEVGIFSRLFVKLVKKGWSPEKFHKLDDTALKNLGISAEEENSILKVVNAEKYGNKGVHDPNNTAGVIELMERLFKEFPRNAIFRPFGDWRFLKKSENGVENSSSVEYDRIGNGTEGDCYRACLTNFSNRKCVAKIAQPRFLNRAIAEAKATVGLNNDNIVMFYGVSVCPPNVIKGFEVPTLIIFLEEALCSGLNWLDATPPLREKGPDSIYAVLLQIACGLRYLHCPDLFGKSESIVHGDLKFGNVLSFSHGRVKLADFGGSKEVSRETKVAEFRPDECFTTRNYRAPEFYDDVRPELGIAKPPNAAPGTETFFTPAFDVFSFGIMVYRLVVLQKLDWESTFMNDLKHSPNKKKMSVLLSFTPFASLSRELRCSGLLQLCYICLHAHPDERPKNGSILAKLVLEAMTVSRYFIPFGDEPEFDERKLRQIQSYLLFKVTFVLDRKVVHPADKWAKVFDGLESVFGYEQRFDGATAVSNAATGRALHYDFISDGTPIGPKSSPQVTTTTTSAAAAVPTSTSRTTPKIVNAYIVKLWLNPATTGSYETLLSMYMDNVVEFMFRILREDGATVTSWQW